MNSTWCMGTCGETVAAPAASGSMLHPSIWCITPALATAALAGHPPIDAVGQGAQQLAQCDWASWDAVFDGACIDQHCQG